MQMERKIENEIKNDQELYSYFRARNTDLTRENYNFLINHPEVKQLLNDYLANILLHKPDDIFKFTKDYFRFLSSNCEADGFTILVGPGSVGKTELLNKLISEFPERFEVPKFVCTKEMDGCILVTEEEFFQLQNNKELILHSFNSKERYYRGLSLREIRNINNDGKIALLETRLEEAMKIYQTSCSCNFIGILPPSLDQLRARIEKHTKLNTAGVNNELVKAAEEIKELESYTFLSFRIINDIFETGFNDFKNAIISLYPSLKYKPEDIRSLESMPDGFAKKE